MYIKFNDSETHYQGYIESFVTQQNHQGVRIVGNDIPLNDSGFKVFSDNDILLVDCSDYIYLYNDNEYTSVEEDPIESRSGYTTPTPTDYDILNNRINSIRRDVVDITPYTSTKKAYIEDTEVIFNIATSGEISAFVVDANGNNLPCSVTNDGMKVTVSFEPLEVVADVTISVA